MLRKEILELLPESPGVYLFKRGNEILYVGKAKNIKNRVNTHRTTHAPFYEKADKIEYILTGTASEALLLEANLIKQYQPRYNIKLTDDKKYPYIAITKNEPYPRVFLTRNLLFKNADIFGPYMSASAIRKALKMLREIFPIRNCKYKLPSRRKINPCIEYHMGLCSAPCIKNRVPQMAYMRNVENIRKVLLGDLNPVIEYLQSEMKKAAESLNFEYAKLLRDRISSLHELKYHFYISSLKEGSIDIIGTFHTTKTAYFYVLFYRDGKIMNTAYFKMEKGTKDRENDVLSAFLSQYYSTISSTPEQIIIPILPENKQEIEETFGFKIELPHGEFIKTMQIAMKNAEEVALQEEHRKRRTHPALLELQTVFGLKSIPEKIECVDASQLFGSFRVASLVVMENGKLRKRLYKRYKIKKEEGKDDFSMIYEVTLRRFKRALKEKEKLPDLYILDGGVIQLQAALKAKKELGIKDVFFAAFAKRFDDFYLENGKRVMLPTRSFSLKLMKMLRDEAHRFAITYHRKLRDRESFRDFLDFVPEIGEKRKKALIEYFGSLKKIREATVEELKKVPGFGEKIAEKLYNFIHGD